MWPRTSNSSWKCYTLINLTFSKLKLTQISTRFLNQVIPICWFDDNLTNHSVMFNTTNTTFYSVKFKTMDNLEPLKLEAWIFSKVFKFCSVQTSKSQTGTYWVHWCPERTVIMMHIVHTHETASVSNGTQTVPTSVWWWRQIVTIHFVKLAIRHQGLWRVFEI